jgi:hypothetical protein
MPRLAGYCAANLRNDDCLCDLRINERIKMSHTIRKKDKRKNTQVIFHCENESQKTELARDAKRSGRSLSKHCVWRLFNGMNEGEKE